MSSDRALTGEWDGIFNYPHTLPSVAFGAIFRDDGGMLSGETTETGDGGSLHALLQGTRTGAAIALVKVYDDGHQTPIAYTGTANDDSSEITGRWSIAGQWSGTFIMVRRPDASAQIDVRIAEIVGRP
ncbi:hypothetical protein DFR49_2625 [Hephaestia caeni]|uniref:Avidin family protein n=1 Tax=Hephaestia caeni TaxID=645617 RepID=A0A397PFC8_9SPHN|nr:hypothetical protein [Hephaestia caeni]RIA44381.1 hypothetical protein DFR49_2625 [Hephaestia caeni]